jgi:Ring hydroxylating alpha subunit (catalytic domain)
MSVSRLDLRSRRSISGASGRALRSARFFYANRSTFNGLGGNLRWTLPRRTTGELRALPEQQWDLIAHTAIVYLLFPNTILVMAQDHLEPWHMFPAGNGIDETRMYVSL